MPWKPTYARQEAAKAVKGAETWKQALDALGVQYHGKNIETLRKWAARWGISIEHLPSGRRRPKTRRRYTEREARFAIAASRSWSEALRRLGYCPTGANPQTLKHRVSAWGIPTDHFDPYAASRGSDPR